MRFDVCHRIVQLREDIHFPTPFPQSL